MAGQPPSTTSASKKTVALIAMARLINPAIANSAVYAKFPGLQSLPRGTAEADVRGINGLINFTTRPNNVFGLTARYR